MSSDVASNIQISVVHKILYFRRCWDHSASLWLSSRPKSFSVSQPQLRPSTKWDPELTSGQLSRTRRTRDPWPGSCLCRASTTTRWTSTRRRRASRTRPSFGWNNSVLSRPKSFRMKCPDIPMLNVRNQSFHIAQYSWGTNKVCMPFHRAWGLVRKLEDLVWYLDVMPTSQMFLGFLVGGFKWPFLLCNTCFIDLFVLQHYSHIIVAYFTPLIKSKDIRLFSLSVNSRICAVWCCS